ncbi:MAG: UvrB/UvrC motif-containing protein [Planctomycetota bacterium]|nr:UvrB/UvrC motif-containing protein [Planctomycetota bacterium]
MKCDHCDNEATVHEVTVRNGVKVERHLCEAHAAEQGIPVKGVPQIGEIIKQHVTAMSQAATTRGSACPSCRTTFGEFKQHGMLGCAACYAAFEAQLGPLIERAHEGAARHVGKKPRRASDGSEDADRAQAELAERARRLARIRAELEDAVKEEQYERAARLRDELRRLGEPPARGAS